MSTSTERPLWPDRAGSIMTRRLVGLRRTTADPALVTGRPAAGSTPAAGDTQTTRAVERAAVTPGSATGTWSPVHAQTQPWVAPAPHRWSSRRTPAIGR